MSGTGAAHGAGTAPVLIAARQQREIHYSELELRTEKLSFLTLPPDKLFLVHAAIDTALKIAD